MPGPNLANGFDDFVRGLVFVDVARGAGLKGGFGKLGLVVLRGDELFNIGIMRLDALDQFQSAARFQRDVHDEQVRLVRRDLLQR